MSHPDDIAAALARLVNGTAPARTSEETSIRDGTPAAERVVTEAEGAIESLPAAAAFVADGGENRLRTAVGGSADERLAERGREVLEALERLRSAAAPSELENPEEHRPADADYFHRGHTTLLKGDGVATE